MGGTISNGYGTINLPRNENGKRTFYVHRVSWELANGPIPNELLVLHKCDVRACVRPDHLYLGDHMENAADMMRKGRGRFGWFPGEKNGRAKLSLDQARSIKSLLNKGYTQKALAQKYGISIATVSLIKLGRRYREEPAQP